MVLNCRPIVGRVSDLLDASFVKKCQHFDSIRTWVSAYQSDWLSQGTPMIKKPHVVARRSPKEFGSRLALDWSDDQLLMGWRSPHKPHDLEFRCYALEPGWVVEGQIQQPKALAELIRGALDEHDWPGGEAAVALGAPFLRHQWLPATAAKGVLTSVELRALIDQRPVSELGLDDQAYFYDARPEPVFASPQSSEKDQGAKRWWLVSAPRLVVEVAQAMLGLCDLRLTRVDVRASVLARSLAATQALSDRCCVIDPHGAFTECWFIEKGKIVTIESYSHARLSEAEHAHHLKDRLVAEMAKGSIESLWTSQALDELVAEVLYQSLGVRPQCWLDDARPGAPLLQGLLQ